MAKAAKTLRLESFFEDLEKGQWPKTFRISGDDPYLYREFRKILLTQSLEFTDLDLKKSGPKFEVEESGSGLSLFTTRKVLCLKNPAAPSQWTSLSFEIWERLKAQCDGDSLTVVLVSPLDKRLKWDSLEVEAEVTFEVKVDQRAYWLQRMNEKRKGQLSKAQLQFLSLLEEDLLLLDNWVELWSLGGDLWAEKTLGWRQKTPESFAANPAFAWVDAVIQGDQKKALNNLRRLEADSQEALQLMGLLTKSVRILAALDLNLSTKGQAPFLVDKLKARKHRARELLGKCQEVDWKLKSSAVDKFTLLSTII